MRERTSCLLSSILAPCIFVTVSLLQMPSASVAVEAPPAAPPPIALEQTGDHLLIGWNDLGMHCSNRDFRDLAVLPPFNTIWAVLILRGDASNPPQVLGQGYDIGYSFPANTYSVGKTDFWSWEDQLFGVQLPENIGLTGKGLTGTLDWTDDHYEAIGIPLTPFDDADLVHEQPLQLAVLEARDGQGQLLASAEIVAPVSNEMTCNACHHPEGSGTVEMAILEKHDEEHGTHLMSQRPVLCANCHASNALGMPGQPELPSLSEAIHEEHAEETNNCYMCHPGPNTQCLRGTMSNDFGMVCQDCHGGMLQVAHSIEEGRRPWLDEPRCGDCHGANFAEEPGTLYRMSNNGHGGLYCATCHNSPHAILPSREERDNRQVVALQGHAGTLRDCTVCHGVVPAGPGPHGYYPSGLTDPDASAANELRVSAAPNPAAGAVQIRYRIADASSARLSIVDVGGREVHVLAQRQQSTGDHALVWDGRDGGGRPVAPGVYFARLENGARSASVRVVRLQGSE